MGWALLLVFGVLAFGASPSNVITHDYKGYKIRIWPSSAFPGRLEHRITDPNGELALAQLSELGELESALVKRLLERIDEWEAARA